MINAVEKIKADLEITHRLSYMDEVDKLEMIFSGI